MFVCRLWGMVLFCIGIGMIVGMMIADACFIILLAALCLLCGYHLFCR